MDLDRAYSLLHVKALDADQRRITGIASTPTLDRQGDILDPTGVRFSNPLPLLLHHDKARPVGRVTLYPPTKDGIRFEAVLPTITEPGALKDRCDEAWQSIKAGLLTGLSVGYRILQDGAERLKSGGLLLKSCEICELSLVTIPANVDATILSVKSLDAVHLVAPDHSSQGVPCIPIVRADSAHPMKQTIIEQIAAFKNTRQTKSAKMADLMDVAAAAGVTLDDAQTKEYDGLAKEVDAIDAHLIRLGKQEQLQIAAAQPAPAPAIQAATPIIQVKSMVPKGTAFVRAACAKLVCNGNMHEAAEYAKRWDDSTPEVALFLKAAMAPGTTTDATWAQPLVNQNIVDDFIELLRPATILGKIPNLRTVPFNCKVPSQTAGGTYGWVGEAKPKPVTKLAFSSETLGIAKAAGIIVLTEELVRLSNPSAEKLVRDDMVKGIAQFLDAQFIDPAVAAVAGVNPASITNGAATAAATANPLADILGLISHFATAGIPVDGVTFIMSAANALALSFRTNLDGSPQFPGIGIGGGAYRGLTFITSQAAGTNVIALQPQMVLYADEGGVSIDASREASLQMDSAPASPADATTVYVSLWQTNSVGLRAERFVNWKRIGASVKYLTAAAYPAPSGAGAMDEPPTTARGGRAEGPSKAS